MYPVEVRKKHALSITYFLVNSTFGEDVEKLYKGFKRHDVDVDALQTSVTLHNQIESNRASQRGPRGGSSFRGARAGFNARGYGSYDAPRGRPFGYGYGYVHDHYTTTTLLNR